MNLLVKKLDRNYTGMLCTVWKRFLEVKPFKTADVLSFTFHLTNYSRQTRQASKKSCLLLEVRRIHWYHSSIRLLHINTIVMVDKQKLTFSVDDLPRAMTDSNGWWERESRQSMHALMMMMMMMILFPSVHNKSIQADLNSNGLNKIGSLLGSPVSPVSFPGSSGLSKWFWMWLVTIIVFFFQFSGKVWVFI